MRSPSEISVVVPVYSGADYLQRLVEEVELVRADWEAEGSPIRLSELILVDDAAVDQSDTIIDQLAQTRPWMTALHLSRNYGQHAATIAGILHSSGVWIVTLDEDLQHRPKLIATLLLHAVRSRSDVAYARPAEKVVHHKAWRDMSSRRVKSAMEWLTGTPTLHLINSFRVLRGSIARATAAVCTHNTYFDIALTWFTQSISAVDLPMRDDRFADKGQSGYNLSKLVVHAQKMLFSSQLRFLSFGLLIGAILFMVSFVAMFYFVFLRLLTPEAIPVQGWTSIFVAICASTGLISVMLGICMQYLSTLVLKAHGRPVFFTVDRSADAEICDWLEARTVRPEESRVA